MKPRNEPAVPDPGRTLLTTDRPLVIVGGGNMGSAFARGLLVAGCDPRSIVVVTPRASANLHLLKQDFGLRHEILPTIVRDACAIVLAVKPELVSAVAAGFPVEARPNRLILSLIAGTTIAELRQLFPSAGAIVRAMTTAVAETTSRSQYPDLAEAVLTTVGKLEWLEREDLLNAATALCGSGPAFVFHFIECLAKAGIAEGLPSAIAYRMADATVSGACALLGQSGRSTSELIREVASSRGTTEAGLSLLMKHDQLLSLLKASVTAATQRSRDLQGHVGF